MALVMKIILASGSPRRRELLSQAGISFEVMTAEIDEQVWAEEMPQDYLKRMVAEKAQAAITLLNSQRARAGTNPSELMKTLNIDSECLNSTPILLLTADTIGILPDGRSILVKPKDKAQALAMWQQMSDTDHQVCTAVQATLLTFNKSATEDQPLTVIWQQSLIECTKVTFVALSNEQMVQYWQSGEPMDKAGGYAIQGGAAAWVTGIEGSYTNVVGLPLAQTVALIDKAQSVVSEWKIGQSDPIDHQVEHIVRPR